jgi:hypothetical protein
MSSSAVQEAIELHRALEKARDKGDDEQCQDIIQRLQGAGLGVEELAASKVGFTVSKLRDHENVNLAAAAKALVKTWKRKAKQQEEGAHPSKGVPEHNHKVPANHKRRNSSASVASAASSADGPEGAGAPLVTRNDSTRSMVSVSSVDEVSPCAVMCETRFDFCPLLIVFIDHSLDYYRHVHE